MQGQLTGRPVAVQIESRCGGCHRALTVRADHELRWRTPGLDGTALIFEPSVDWSHFFGPSIIHDY